MKQPFKTRLNQFSHFILLTIMSVTAPAYADELSLNDAVIASLATDERIAAARSNLRSAEEGRVGARSFYKPRVNAVGSLGYNDVDQFNSAGSLQRDGRKMYGGIEVQQDIFTFGRNRANVRKSEAQINIAQFELTATQHEVILDTVSAFLSTRASEATVTSYNDHVATLLELLKSTEAKFKLSLVTATELALVTSRHQQAIAQHSMATAELQTRRDQLLRLIHRDFTSLGNPLTGQSLLIPDTVDDAIESALSNSPLYLKAYYEMAVAKANLDVVSAERYPALTATGRWVKGRVGDLPTGDKEIGLSMSMPLYDGGMASSKVRRAKHDLNSARYTKDNTERQTEQNARSAFITLNSARHVSTSWQSALAAEEKSLSGIEKEVEANLEGLPYLLEAKDKMMMVRIQAIDTDTRARLAEYELLAATGHILASFIEDDRVIK